MPGHKTTTTSTASANPTLARVPIDEPKRRDPERELQKMLLTFLELDCDGATLEGELPAPIVRAKVVELGLQDEIEVVQPKGCKLYLSKRKHKGVA